MTYSVKFNKQMPPKRLLCRSKEESTRVWRIKDLNIEKLTIMLLLPFNTDKKSYFNFKKSIYKIP